MGAGEEISLGPLEDVVVAGSEALGQTTRCDTVGALEVDVAVGADVD